MRNLAFMSKLHPFPTHPPPVFGVRECEIEYDNEQIHECLKIC